MACDSWKDFSSFLIRRFVSSVVRDLNFQSELGRIACQLDFASQMAILFNHPAVPRRLINANPTY